MNHQIEAILSSTDVPNLEAVEVSGRNHAGRGWRSFESLSYPAFDLCSPPPVMRQFDWVIAEQVLEHVRDPWRAAETLHRLCRPGGNVLVTTPFLIRIHHAPADYWRFTPDGLRLVLERAGFSDLRIGSWGNRDCVAVFDHWPRRQPWHSLRNEPELPAVVWACGKRSHG